MPKKSARDTLHRSLPPGDTSESKQKKSRKTGRENLPGELQDATPEEF